MEELPTPDIIAIINVLWQETVVTQQCHISAHRSPNLNITFVLVPNIEIVF